MHGLALLEIDPESTFDGVGNGAEDSSCTVRFFVSSDLLQSLIAVLDDFLRRQGVVIGESEMLDDARGYDCRGRVGAVHVAEYRYCGGGRFRRNTEDQCACGLMYSRLVQH